MSEALAHETPNPVRRATEPTTGRYEMTISVNRILDVLVSFATVGLALTIAGATALLGA